MRHSHRRSVGWDVRLAEDAYSRALHDGRIVSGTAHSHHFHLSARFERQKRPGRESHEDAARRIVHKQGAVPGIDVGIAIGDYRAQVNRILPCRLFGGEAMDLVCCDENMHRTRGALGIGSRTGQGYEASKSSAKLRPHPIPALPLPVQFDVYRAPLHPFPLPSTALANLRAWHRDRPYPRRE